MQPKLLTALISDAGTEAELMREIIEPECSVDAAEQNVWHMAMNKNGAHHLNGEILYSRDGTI